MIRILTMVFICLSLALPCIAATDDQLALLEAAAQQDDDLQPGLENYQVTVETPKIAEMIQNMTASMPPDTPRPKVPMVTKYWLRGAPRSLIVATIDQSTPYVAQVVERLSSSLTVELDSMLLPADKLAERQELVQKATVKITEVALADNLLQRFEIHFSEPTDLGEAFYKTGIRLPQKGIVALTFDIDVKTKTITEMSLTTADKLQLTAEIRYRTIASGFLPERIRVTSPDGQVDDLFEIAFVTIEGFELPAHMNRTIRSPNLKDDLDVTFKDYRINQPLPEQIRSQLMAGS